MIDFEKKLNRSKYMYSGIILSLRTKVINDRIKYPSCGPNKLILEVSATEGIARTILIKILIEKGLDPEKAFKKVNNIREVKKVFEKIYRLKQIERPPLFKTRNWEIFLWAIQFRNFLIHHCAFVGDTTSNPLIKATIAIRKRIANEWLKTKASNTYNSPA